MAVQATVLATHKNATGSVIFDPNFLGTGLARKLYATLRDDYEMKTVCHSHEAIHFFVVSYGSRARLATCEGGSVVVIDLKPGARYFVPAQVPHQLWIRGPIVLESYYPTSFLIKALAKLPTAALTSREASRTIGNAVLEELGLAERYEKDLFAE